MRHVLLATALITIPVTSLTAAPAAAQSPELEQACITVAKNFLLTPALKTGMVQSFPELDPPGARLTYSTRDKPEATDFTDQIECSFERATAPFGLTRFCVSDTCYSASEEKPEHRRRFEEMKALLARQK
ncbi:hypothetical protein [Rhizobium straminoryzae]|uniref:UrcA family protein n=1 Tax=Rhizobium straminoryzae TaxID=1387186 RepID=A0A549TAJ6_9HYPH|nr:hypothetical protein [Rhizobium straminoryzae]TRL38902.1 hypothetical protein FNA46_11225 [Rhizobium straminoryzae]